jgi:hypothetical protein
VVSLVFGNGSNESKMPNAKQKNRILKKSFRSKVAFRLAGICFLGCLTGYLFFDSPYWMAGLWTALGTAALFMKQ